MKMTKTTLLTLMAVMAITVCYSLTASALTVDEKNGLLFMREEEKLARDVYLTLAGEWDLPIFDNIASSEQVHMDRILGLLRKYKLQDPAAKNGIGEFTNPVFTEAYANLTAKGTISLVDALEVGVIIEEMDIADLTALIAQTNRRDIKNVYTNLRSASYNHLNAFNKVLAAQTN